MEKFLLLSLLFSMAIITCSATTYTVGDSSGWDISSDLETWVANKNFKIGDALLFQYSSTYSVDEVTKGNFETCNTTKVLANYGNGNTTVPLTRGGDRYFVCGNKLFCLGGMKLHVHVDDDDGRSISPALAPKAVAGTDERTSSLPESPSAPFSNGVANGADIVYIAIAAIFYGMLQI
ncbi:unnamed protein product [Vicia faba]|uniref:Phytocyanin domain-containing protein n=1 Tax=Vicia faba TaxID=3906 RepID=A0AAV1A670_VICFA|nr:unnamed protein product [Vicia faba]